MNMINIFKAKAKTLLERTLLRKLEKAGYMKAGYIVATGQEYIYAEGDIPVLLVAHVDTVHKKPPKKIFHDPKHNVLWSPDGLGADDRAGVWAILKLIQDGYRPHVLFTDGEESGGTGAVEVIETLDPPDVNIIVELDRKGSNDAVYYNCDCSELEEYISYFGFETARGIFTDIVLLCPEWGIAGVNLSVGYYNAHSNAEYLCLNKLRRTIERVAEMLENPPKERFEYKEKPHNIICYKNDNRSCHLLEKCDSCDDWFVFDELYEDNYGLLLCEYCYQAFYGRLPDKEGGDIREAAN